jgi:hypothetical protein
MPSKILFGLRIFLAIVFVATLPISKFNGVSTSAGLLLFILNIPLIFQFFSKKENLQNLLFLLPIAYFVLVALPIYPDASKELYTEQLFRKIGLALTPIGMAPFIWNQKKAIRILSWVFYLSLVIVCLYSLIFKLHFLWYNGEITLSQLTYFHLSGPINFQPIYFSMYVGWAIFIGFFSRNEVSKKLQIPLWISQSFLFFFLIMLSSRTEIIAFLLISFSIAAYFGWKNWGAKKTFLRLSLAAIAAFLLIFSSPLNRERFAELLNPNAENLNWGGRELRLKKWKASLVVIRENLPLGTGPANAQNALNNEYEKTNFEEALKESYNSHSQYLQSFVELGILGGLLFIGYIFYGIYYSAKKRNLLMLVFFVFFGLSCLSESMFERNKGLVFAVFIPLLCSANSSKNENSSLI